MGIKIASFRSLKRLLGFVGHSDPSLGFASFLLGQLFYLWFSGLLSPLWITACSELCSQYQHVPGTTHPPAPSLYQREQPEPGAGPGVIAADLLGIGNTLCPGAPAAAWGFGRATPKPPYLPQHGVLLSSAGDKHQPLA